MNNPVDLQRPDHVPGVALAGESSGGAELVDRCLWHCSNNAAERVGRRSVREILEPTSIDTQTWW